MDMPTTLQILQGWNSGSLSLVIDALNKKGVITDEESTGLSSYMIEHWNEACTEYLLIHGYAGGKIKTCAKYFPHLGAVYALYDEALLEFEEITGYLENKFKPDEEL